MTETADINSFHRDAGIWWDSAKDCIIAFHSGVRGINENINIFKYFQVVSRGLNSVIKFKKVFAFFD